MSGTEGLVKRRNVPARETQDQSPSKDVDEDERRIDYNEEDDGDSKETRLTLMEEVLLLGLKDKEVRK